MRNAIRRLRWWCFGGEARWRRKVEAEAEEAVHLVHRVYVYSAIRCRIMTANHNSSLILMCLWNALGRIIAENEEEAGEECSVA